MNPLLIGPIADVVGKVVDRLFPDKQAAAAAKLEVYKLEKEGELAELDSVTKLALAQAEINKVEAAAPDFFTRGWRPSVGWICSSALGYQLLIRPLLIGFEMGTFPSLETDSLMTLLFGLLGLGAYRTVEKIKGASK